MKLSLRLLYLVLTLMVLNACGKGNVSGPDSPIDPGGEPPVDPPTEEVSTRFSNEDDLFLPGELQPIEVSGMTLDKEEYEAQLDGSEKVMLQRDSDQVLYLLVPLATVGEHTLEFSLNEQQQSLSFSLDEYEEVADPEEYMEQKKEEVDLQVQEYSMYLQFLQEEGLINSETLLLDKTVWDQIDEQASQEWEAMTPEQKQWVVTIVENNQSWIDRLDALMLEGLASHVKRKAATTTECKTLRDQGKSELSNGNTLTAAWIALKYKWCQVDLVEEVFPEEEVRKARILWESTENQYAQFTLINLIGRKIDQASKWFDEQGSSTFVADRFGSLKKPVYQLESGMRYSFSVPIVFRSVSKEDAAAGKPYASFASMFNEYVDFYSLFSTSLNQQDELIWRPTFRSRTETVQFNRFLSIPQSGISNDKIILLNDQVEEGQWVISFATDEKTDQEFTFDVVYDDGHVKLTKTLHAKLMLESPLNGWYAGDYTLTGREYYPSCGSQFGQSGRTAIYVYDNGQGNEPTFIVYSKSIVPGIPDIYKKITGWYLFSNQFMHSWGENGRNFSFEALKLDVQSSITSITEGMVVESVPAGTGNCGEDSQWKYSYGVSVYAPYLGKEMPEWVDGEIVNQLLNDPEANKTITVP